MPRHRTKRKKTLKTSSQRRPVLVSCYLHYGDRNHLPMQTVHFTGTRAALSKEIASARREGWPVRVQNT